MISTDSMRGITLLVAAVALIGVMAVPATPVYACSCIPPEPPGIALQRASAVFVGRAAAVEDAGRRLLFTPVFPFVQLVPRGFGPVTTTFEVSRIWKGPKNGRLTVEAAADDGMCGFRFAQGQEYVVYASGEGSGLSTDSCSRTRALDAADEDLLALGDGIVPEALAQETGSGWSWLPLVWIAAVLLLGMSVARTVRRRRTTTDHRPPTTDHRPPTTNDE